MTPTQVANSGLLIWLTGLSGAGKSTLAQALDRILTERGSQVHVLDGDRMRQGLCSDLGFSVQDRIENVRRIGEVAGLLVEHGCVVITACISPIRASRDAVRHGIAAGRFIEVYLNCPLEICRQRDPKGMYAKALANQLQDFTGVSSPYEPPLTPELELATGSHSVDQCTAMVMSLLEIRIPSLRRTSS